MPEVAKCNVQQCTWNEQGMQCNAPSIQVATHQDHADCETYTPK